MGVVFRAHDPAMGRDVALKVLRLDTSLSDAERNEISRCFEAEARAAGGLSHPNIVAHYERGEINGHKYIVMELVDGAALHHVMLQGQPLESNKCLALLRQIAAALDYAHSRGVVHRDVKPANILVQQGETVKVADFGIAKSALSPGITATAVMIGSPHYMSPEQIEAQAVSSRTDQWALAVTAYELLAGRKPFHSESIASLFQQILSAPPPDPAEFAPGIPRAARSVFAKALSKSPEQRFEHCTAFIEALDECFRQEPAGVISRLPRLQRLRAYALVSIALVTVATSSVLAWSYFPRSLKGLDKTEEAVGLRNGEVRVNRRDGLAYVWIAPGSFQMGCSSGDTNCEDDEQSHHVTLTQDYWIAKTEVTVQAFKRFSAATGGQMPAAHASNPTGGMRRCLSPTLAGIRRRRTAAGRRGDCRLRRSGKWRHDPAAPRLDTGISTRLPGTRITAVGRRVPLGS